jgi:hypothetical protein
MWISLVGLLTLTAAEPELRSGAQWHFQGTVTRDERGPREAVPEKSFDLTVLVTRNDDAGLDADWVLDERGAGSFGWIERFGRWMHGSDGSAVGPSGPALLFDYGTGKHVVPLLPVRIKLPESLAAGTKWESDGLEHELLRESTVNERRVWEVEVRNQFGPQRKLWVDPTDDAVLKYEARVFMNQGTEYKLAVRLVDVDLLEPAAVQQFDGGIAALTTLREKLKRAPRKIEAELTPEQLQVLKAGLPTAKESIADGALAKIATAAERDLETQASRKNSLEEMTAKQLGRKVEAFSVEGADQAKLTDADLRDQVTVLHFWDYRDQPLHEPYGQVGYLEFLYGRRKGQGLKVVGVAVDGRFQQPATAGAAAGGVRRLRTFMNLTYPIVYDGGALLRQFGDPRTVGGTLPLFVVVGRDGTVAHYKVGHYGVDREAGLKQLDETVESLLDAGR